jgi:Uma2 family endonuclease
MVLAKTMEMTKARVTAEELWHMGSLMENFELVKGELIEMTPPGGTYGSTAVNLSSILLGFIKEKKLGAVMVETGYKLASQPDTVRAPDVSFLSAAKIPSTGLPDGYIDGAPDLAVEIVSPGDTASEIQDKVQDYLAHGAQLVWVVYPAQRLVLAYYPDGAARTLHAGDTLADERVLPGFTCPVKDIFGVSFQ